VKSRETPPPPSSGRHPDPATAAALRRALPALCRERGVQDLELADLSARAGIGEAKLRRGYGDLQGACVAVFRDFAEEFSERMLAAYQAEPPEWRRQIRAVAYAFLAYLQEDPDRAYFTIVDAVNAGTQAQLVREEVISGLCALIDQGRGELADPDSLSPATAEAVGGAVFLRMRGAIEAGESERLPALVPELMQIVTLPYLGPLIAAEEANLAPPAAGPTHTPPRSVHR